MVNYSALTDRSAVEAAIAEFDSLGRDAFLLANGFGEAKEYFLVTDSGRYDSKAIFGVAWRIQHGEAIGPDDFNGGASGAAGQLEALGYVIEGLAPSGVIYDSFAAAVAAFHLPLENHAKVWEFVSARSYEEIRIPASGTYISLTPAGSYRGRGKAFVHSGYIWHRDLDGNGHTVELPTNKLRDGGGSRSDAREAAAQFCDKHFMQLSVSGTCPECES